MKRKIKFTVKNVILIMLALISFVVFAVSACFLDSEPLWIPFTTMIISFALLALFSLVNQDLLVD